MTLTRILGSLLTCAVVAASPLFSEGESLTKKRILADLESIHHIFDVKYAPKNWKHEFAQWNLEQSIDDAKNKIIGHPQPTLKECQVVVRDFFNSTRDYHVGVRFFSTESSALPFLVKGSKGRYFVSHVEKDSIFKNTFPFQVGDEIISFDRKPIHEVIEELRKREFGNNTFETDQALAEMSLTHRRGDLGHTVPSGTVEIIGIKKGSRSPEKVTLTWSYTPEKIRDISKITKPRFQSCFDDGEEEMDLKAVLKKGNFFNKCMMAAFWDQKSTIGELKEPNKHALGARQSYIPKLGSVVWKSNPESIFDAYIFTSPSGKRIGYIRLPHYLGDKEEVVEFGEVMNFFQKRTEALVIDQINNPGGSVFYLYALAATLSDKPLITPKHRIAMTQEEVYIAHLLLPYLDQITDDEMSRLAMGDTMGGYPVDFNFVQITRQFCRFLIDQWESGNFYSEPTFLYGVNEIQPHPEYSYTKPILLLINSLDFSGGDFFPAILQDNKRATILGTRTAGAGGYVLNAEFPNHSGIKGFILTGSLAERIDKKPIENLGVRPDIAYELSVIDLQENYTEYVAAIVKAVEEIATKK
jgi:C-terminal processing protease CtpA/Prc